MFRPHPDALLGGSAVIAVALLLALAHVAEPPLLSLAEAAAREGARVAIEARVMDAHDGPRARRLALSDGALRLPAFAPLAPALERGDVVRAEGIVTRDELGVVLSLESVEVVVPTGRVVRTPADLAERPGEFEGAFVVVTGAVSRGVLSGDGARLRLAGEIPPDGAAVVAGVFRYHERDAWYVVQVESWTPPP